MRFFEISCSFYLQSKKMKLYYRSVNHRKKGKNYEIKINKSLAIRRWLGGAVFGGAALSYIGYSFK